jgi:hypothetical protein
MTAWGLMRRGIRVPTTQAPSGDASITMRTSQGAERISEAIN